MIELVHDADVNRDEDHEDVNAPLLGEPEAELKSAELELVELFDKKDAATVGDEEPDGEENAQPFEVGAPVSGAVAVI